MALLPVSPLTDEVFEVGTRPAFDRRFNVVSGIGVVRPDLQYFLAVMLEPPIGHEGFDFNLLRDFAFKPDTGKCLRSVLVAQASVS